jgi:hypothetical protein
MLESVVQFRADHPLDPENPRAEALTAEVSSAAEDLSSMGGTQEFHRLKVSGTSSERQQIAARMRKMMRQIARVAKVLDRAEYPDARFKLRVPRSNGYQHLLNRARVYLETVVTMKHEFTNRGMPADFDTRLQALLDQFDAATRKKNSSLSGQISSTANMKERLRQGVRAVRELDVILGLLYEDHPALYHVWRSASHIQRAPRRGDTPEVHATPAPAQASAPIEVAHPAPGEASAARVDNPVTPPASPPVDNSPDSQLAFW